MVYDDWKELLPIVRDLWHALVAVTIHYIWTDRNSRIFDKRVSPPILPSIGIIFTTFSAHVRFFRRQCYSSEQNAQLDQILTELRRFGSYKQFSKQNPNCYKFGGRRKCVSSHVDVRTTLRFKKIKRAIARLIFSNFRIS